MGILSDSLGEQHLSKFRIRDQGMVTWSCLSGDNKVATSDGGGMIAASIYGVNLQTFRFSIPNRAQERYCKIYGGGYAFILEIMAAG